jgi:DNA-binding transcriptional LysR family regulator
MDTEEIRTFLEIVRQGSFSKAARELDLAQPTVSTRIQALDKEAGGALLPRRRWTTLTELGETFLPYAQRLLETFMEGREAVRLAKTGQRGHVHIGTFFSLAATLLPDVIVTFRTQYPHVSLRIREGLNEEIVVGLQDGDLELGHVAWPWPLTPPNIVPILAGRQRPDGWSAGPNQGNRCRARLAAHRFGTQ